MKNVLLDKKNHEERPTGWKDLRWIPLCSAERQPIHVYVSGRLFFDVISTEISIAVQANYDQFPTPYPSLGARGHNNCPILWVPAVPFNKSKRRQ